jgi:hypothetical protein
MFQRILGVVTLVFAAAFAVLAVGGNVPAMPAGAREILIALVAFLLGSGCSLLLVHGARGTDPESNEARSRGWAWVRSGDWLEMIPQLHDWMMVLPDGDVMFVGRTVTLGSSSACDVVLDDPWVLPYHAKMRWDGSRVVITDLSSGQLFVDGQRVRGSVALSRGASVALGSSEVVLRRDVSGLADSSFQRMVGRPA